MVGVTRGLHHDRGWRLTPGVVHRLPAVWRDVNGPGLHLTSQSTEPGAPAPLPFTLTSTSPTCMSKWWLSQQVGPGVWAAGARLWSLPLAGRVTLG